MTAALSLAVYAIVTANGNGWGSARTLGLGAAAAALLLAFVMIESRRDEPLVRLGIFRTHNLAASNAVMALLGAAWIPMWFYLNLYLQQVLGFGAFASGAALLPMTVAIMILMVGVTGRVVGRFGFKPPMVTGLVLLGVGIALFARVPADGGFVTDVLGASLIAAAGMSLAYIPALVASLASAKPEEAGLASGLVNTSYQVGSALGLAAMTAVAIAVGDDLTDGYRAAFIGAAGVAALAGVVAAVAVRRPPAAVDEVEAEPLKQAA